MTRSPHRHFPGARCSLVSLALCALTSLAGAQILFEGQQKIGSGTGGFGGVLAPQDRFGRGLALLGDLDGDGVPDLAVGPHRDDEGGTSRGAVWILFLNADGTVREETRISSVQGGFEGVLEDEDNFGFSVAALGDLDGDGVVDLAAGAHGNDDGAEDSGSVWILFLNPDGSVRDEHEISAADPLLGPLLSSGDRFGHSLARVGDLDGDGTLELAVGANHFDGGGIDRGAVFLLSIASDGSLADVTLLAEGSGGLSLALEDGDQLGFAVSGLNDLDGDGVLDLAAGISRDDDGGTDRGALVVLFLNSDGSVRTEQKISATSGGFGGTLDDSDTFGSALAFLGDLDGNGMGAALAVGAPLDDDGGTDRGAAWILELDAQGLVQDHSKLSETSGGMDLPLGNDDRFAVALCALGDFDGDGDQDLCAGATRDDMNGQNTGACYLNFLEGPEVGISEYGCGVNPSGTLSVLSGGPILGTTMQWALDNPFGTQSAGSTPTLFFSFQPDPAYPCGTIFPAFGMPAPNTPGELLVSMLPGELTGTFGGTQYGGPGQPAVVTVNFPNNAALAGVRVYTQGYLLDATQSTGTGVRIGMTTAFEMVMETQ